MKHNTRIKRNLSVIKKHNQGFSCGQIVKMFHISRQRVHQIIHFMDDIKILEAHRKQMELIEKSFKKRAGKKVGETKLKQL